MKKILMALETKLFPFNYKNLFLFPIIWLMVGFSLGTATLMGPVRWVTNYARNSSIDPSLESWAVRLIILLFLIISFSISVFLIKGYNYLKSKLGKSLIVVMPFLLTILSLWLWLNPKMMQFNSSQTTESYSNIEFIFGPYPEEEKIIELKKENITAVISLLHEAVVPFEPKLLGDEIELTNKYGIELIHLPMLPWVSSNETSLNAVRELAKNGSGKYYVHCYLGKDRVGVVRRIIKEVLGEENISGIVNKRNIEDFTKFERGSIIKLDDQVYMTPYPTDEEFFAFILNGSFENVVSLLNPENPKDLPWIEKENKILAENKINHHLMPVKINPYDPSIVYKYVEKIKGMKRPILIHAFLTKSPQSDVFVDCYKMGEPVVPEYIFSRYLKNGKVNFIQPNIVFGPEPKVVEIYDYLYVKGIRKIGYAGKLNEKSKALQREADRNNIDWINLKQNNIDVVLTGGPWYLFGENSEKLLKSIM